MYFIVGAPRVSSFFLSVKKHITHIEAYIIFMQFFYIHGLKSRSKKSLSCPFKWLSSADVILKKYFIVAFTAFAGEAGELAGQEPCGDKFHAKFKPAFLKCGGPTRNPGGGDKRHGTYRCVHSIQDAQLQGESQAHRWGL